MDDKSVVEQVADETWPDVERMEAEAPVIMSIEQAIDVLKGDS